MKTATLTVKHWRFTAITLAVALLVAVMFIVCIGFLATRPLSTHYNLYYLMWKCGFRSYDSVVARAGMFYDHNFRTSLRGISIEDFENQFPSTFYELEVLPPSAKSNQRYFIDNYRQSKNTNGAFGMAWLAIFEDGKLIELEYSKG